MRIWESKNEKWQSLIHVVFSMKIEVLTLTFNLIYFIL